jgi:hypothetical protein
MRWLGKWEWILIELLVLGLAVAELISIQRTIRADKKAAKPPPDPD